MERAGALRDDGPPPTAPTGERFGPAQSELRRALPTAVTLDLSLLLARDELMKRIDLIPTVTTDGRHIIFQAMPIPPRERARRLVEKLRPKRAKRD